MPLKLATTELNPRQFRPFCKECGWRKGGPDSWNGVTCKCGETEPVLTSADEIPPPSMLIFD